MGARDFCRRKIGRRLLEYPTPGIPESASPRKCHPHFSFAHRAEPLSDVDVDIAHPLHTQLRSLLGQLAQNAPEAREGLNLIMSQGGTPGTLTNLLGAHATSDPYVRRQLLENTEVEKRLQIATRYIGERS